MDLSSTFKEEVYRTIVVVLIPGGLALSPFLMTAFISNDHLSEFYGNHPNFSAFLLVTCAIAAGLIIENFGSCLEKEIDQRLERDNPKHMSDWWAYLSVTFEKEPIGQSYLRTILLRLKFELSMFFSLIIFSIGLIITSAILCTFNLYILFAIVLATPLAFYLKHEAYNSCKLLAKVRAKLIK